MPRVIDLGEDFTPVETPEEIGQRGVRRRRFAMIAGLVLLTLLTVASAAAATPALRKAATLPVTPQSVAMLVGSRVLVAGIYDHANELNAYDVRSGALIWSTRLSVLTHGSSLARSGDVAVVTYSSEPSAATRPTRSTSTPAGSSGAARPGCSTCAVASC